MKSTSPALQIWPSFRLQPTTWLSNIFTSALPDALVHVSRVPEICTAVRVTMYTSVARLPLGFNSSIRPVGGAETGGAVRGTGRFASQDTELQGVLFPAGTFIAPALAVANRDESVWTDADRFDITREPTGQPHLTFGSGIHYCLGASLARAELQEALPLLARRLPDLRLDGPITWKPETAGIWGAAHMPITFSPGR